MNRTWLQSNKFLLSAVTLFFITFTFYTSFSTTITKLNYLDYVHKNLYVSLSSTNDPVYFLSLPLAAISWINIGVQPIVCLAGNAANYKTAEIQPVFDFFARFNISYRFVNSSGSIPANVIAQTCRIFPASSDEFHPDDVIITGDSDLVPFHLHQHWQPQADLFLYNSRCCGELTIKNREFPMYPMCTIAAKRDEWRRIFGFTGDAYNNGTKLETILVDFFGAEFFQGPTEKGSPNWFTDQNLVSYWIDVWKEKYNGKIMEQEEVIGRMDRLDWPNDTTIRTANLDEWMDAHLPIGVLETWPQVRPLFVNLLRKELLFALQQYIHSLETFVVPITNL